MSVHECYTCLHMADVKQSSDPERIMHSTTPPHKYSFAPVQQDFKHKATASQSLREALLNYDREGAWKGKFVKAKLKRHDTMDMEVPSQDPTPAMTRTDMHELIPTKTKRSADEMIANEIMSRNDKELDLACQSATLSSQGRICTVVYDVFEQVLLDLIRQNVLGEKIDKRISNNLEVGISAKTISNKLLANHAFMTPVAAFVQRKATESVANQHLATTLEQAHTMKHEKLEDEHITTAALPIRSPLLLVPRWMMKEHLTKTEPTSN